MAPRNKPEFYSVEELHDILGIHEGTVRRFIKDGRLRSHRIGRLIRVSDEDLKAYLAARRE